MAVFLKPNHLHNFEIYEHALTAEQIFEMTNEKKGNSEKKSEFI